MPPLVIPRACSRWSLCLLVAWMAGLWLSQPARGQNLSREAIPTKWLAPYVPETLPPLAYPAYFNDLDKAKAQSFAGRYKMSLLTLRKISEPKESDRVEIALVRGRSLGAIGQKKEAMAILSDPKIADEARVQIARAKLLVELGRQDEAVTLLQEHLKKYPKSIAGHYYLGQVLEYLGQIPAASDAYAWFEPFIDQWQGQGASGFSSAEDVTLIGRGLDRWATLTKQYVTRSALNNIIFSMFLKSYDEIDRSYWPAHVAAAEYSLSHDDPQAALKELQIAYKANPQDIHTLAARWGTSCSANLISMPASR